MALITEVPLEQQALDQVILFQAADGQVTLDVRLEADTVWLSQAQMAALTHHVGNVFREGELPEKSNVHFLHIAGADRSVGFYSLDVIISVGYRVKSPRSTQFRIWATQVLRNGAPASSKGCASLKRATGNEARAH